MAKEKSEFGDDVVSAKVDSREKVSPRKMVTLTFRGGNRKFELHACRQVYIFLGNETKEVPIEVLSDRHWRTASKYFIVKGV